MKDPLFGHLEWHGGFWKGTVSLPFFAGYGAALKNPAEPPDPWDDDDDDVPPEDEDDANLKRGVFELHVTPAGGQRLKPADAQRRAWQTILDRGDAPWKELMRQMLDEYRRQRPVRVRWWKAVFGSHALSRSLPDLRDVRALSRMIRPMSVLIQPHPVAPATTPDVLVQFAGTWLPSGIAAILRDGRVADFSGYAAPDRAENPVRFDHPVFGRLSWNDHYAAWGGPVRWSDGDRRDGLETFVNVAPMRANFEANRARFKNPELPLEWDFVEGRFATIVHVKGVEVPTARQAAACESFRAKAKANAAAIAAAIHAEYRRSGTEPKIPGPDAMREHLELATVHVFPDDLNDSRAVPVGFDFYGPSDTAFGVRFRDGEVEAIGDSDLAQPPPRKPTGKRPVPPKPAAPQPTPPPAPPPAAAPAKTRSKSAAGAANKPAAKPSRPKGRVGYFMKEAADRADFLDEYFYDFEIVSDRLDPDMHPKGTLRVRVPNDPKSIYRRRTFGVSIEQDLTLFHYLRKQSKIRQQLDEALAVDQEQRWPEGEPVRGDVWSWARLLRLEFNQPSRRRKNPPKFAFTLYLDCDWEEEHEVVAEFEDDRLRKLSTQ